ncbi:ABC transporter permease [Alicyclobacillus sp. SO9]|uniref:ABC transporter permease n=1 Tax=Alicyclobacillus sp. SO9 TaxID=2665646 RepID=UPI0018E7017D|nr:ABC transporter permease [Alicyclobacillus sp. SO9]QQE79093.1 ABC transporter permease [Alicyclobacillus sp. SO9]
MNFIHLVQNELTKMLKKRRFHVVLAILFVLMAVFSYAEHQASIQVTKQLGTADWHVHVQKQITHDANRLKSPFLTGTESAVIKAQMSEFQYELNHNIDPYAPGAPSFMKTFMDEGSLLLIPMLVVVIASDMVSSEMSGGTIKVLLTRGVPRWKVLASKLVALVFLTAMLIGAVGLSAYVVSGIFFGYQGFHLPIPMGFHTLANGTISVTHVYTITQWKYLIMTYGLGFISSLAVAVLSFMVSVLVRSTASSMGIMMAALISGTLLTSLASSWQTAKYLPVVNLQLSTYLNGSPPPVAGMNFSFSMVILTVWSIAALAVSFWVFTQRDILG